MTDTPNAKTVADLIDDIPIAMLTTVGEQGRLVSRPMAHQEVEDDADLWFFAERDSHVATEVARDPNVGVTFSSSSTWVSLAGRAEIVTDVAKAKQLWNAVVEAWLPQGPEDPSVILIKVSGDSAEYWDTPGRVATLISFAKAKATGKPYEGGENETVQL